ncbi:TonB-dependent receptor [Lacinutrix sp. C3R15]|uniref:TonB-dependent receptor n=1 Tax=Flavobacteriaceae TaxID=49546 RepID=UPI001C0A3652|nr:MULTISPECIES: TonB-dependent receptor [Flavobacteriaceae]MBU2938316.1 TonB-dependent receptor [Lacinutrix sp. C3R15]MDO6621630.1 TonB-dependent receptor [Oceanihabitans sp. 1_MG-2023]
MKNSKYLINILILFISCVAFSQSGKVVGTVIDGDFTEPLAFANILVKGTTTGTASDFDGKYNIDLDEGTHTLIFSFVGYNSQEITDVVIKSGEIITLDVTLSANTLETVVVSTSVKRNTENAVLNFQKKSANLLDGLSAQTIKKTGASNIASAVKSVPGVSVEGGKYVYVRGLGDRYTKSILNGVDIPGLDPDRNTIPMDIFPTNIIDNVIVVKSAAAEYPADFTGGIVNIVTKDFPTKEEYSVSVGMSFNPNMHLKDNYLSYDGSNSDFLGYDNGARNRPINRYQSIPGTFENKQLLTTLTSSFDSQLGADVEKSGLNYDFGFTLGNQYEVGDSNKLGYQASLSYKNKTTFYEETKDGSYTRDNSNGNLNNELAINRTVEGSYGQNEILLNGLIGLAYKTDNSKYKLTALHIQNGESTAGNYDLLISEAGVGSGLLNGTNDVLLYTERSITNFAISGDHSLDANSDIKLDWVFSPSFSRVLDKDHRTTPLRIVENQGTTQYEIDASSVGSPLRVWRTLSEESWVGNVNLSKKYELFNRPAKLKVGGGYTFKYRDFSTDQYLFDVTSPIVANGDVNNLLAQENIWTTETQSGTFLDSNNAFDAQNAYEGEYNVGSMYISNEFNPAEKLKAIVGLRTEKFDLYYTGVTNEGAVIGKNTIDKFDFFPSANLIFAVSDRTNIRGSYSRTTARPSFKEASTAQIYDPTTNRFFIGGLDNNTFDNVKPSYINNFDLRYEVFREKGQMIALSGFYKDFKDPIELVSFPQASNQMTVTNTGNAQVIGAEIELRQALGFIANSLENLRFNANVSVINSELKMTDQEYNLRLTNARVGENIEDTRQMQGQSPFLLNAGFDYGNDDNGFRTGIYYNVQGKTLEVVGNGFVPDVYTKPFHSLNFTLNKAFGENKNSAIDFKISNILGSDRESVYESYNANDQIFKLRSPGTEISLGYSYKF